MADANRNTDRKKVRINPMPQSEEKLHYDSLIKFISTVLGIAGTVISAIVGIALYFSYSSASDMKKEYKESLEKFTEKIALLEDDEKATIKDIKFDANQAVAKAQVDSKEAISTAKADLRDQIKTTNDATQIELTRIKAETNRMALLETQSQVKKVFDSGEIEAIIQNQAVASIKKNLTPIVSNYTKNLTKINDAALRTRMGLPKGLRDLKQYFIKSTNSMDSLFAKQLFDQIGEDYYVATIKYKMNFVNHQPNEFDNPPGVYSGFKIQQNKYPSVISDQQYLSRLLNIINNEDDKVDLNIVSEAIVFLSTIANMPFRPFKIDEINRWYNSLEGKRN